MAAYYPNSSVPVVSHRPTDPINTINDTDENKTVYDYCTDMHGVLIWYLGLQFINMFLGLPANIRVLYLIRKNKGDSSTADIYIFQLAILDLFFCLIPPLEVANIIFLTTDSTWYVMRFFYGLKDFSPLLLSCICLDRYLAVIHPITFNMIQDRKHRVALSLVVWLIILAYACLKCVADIDLKIFTVMILAAFFFMVFCNIAILRVLRQSWPGRDEVHPVKKRAFKMVLIILAIIVFNYLPPVALFPFKPFFSVKVFKCYIHYIAFGLMNFSSSVQPLLYLSKEKLPRGSCQTSTTQTQLE